MNVAKATSIHRRRSITIDKLPDKNKVMFLDGLFWPFVHGGFVVYVCAVSLFLLYAIAVRVIGFFGLFLVGLERTTCTIFT